MITIQRRYDKLELYLKQAKLSQWRLKTTKPK